MAKGRTVSATELTDKDSMALAACEVIARALAQAAPDGDAFMREYGAVHFSRDAGLGLAGKKLQRDALCTRGRTDKAPFSNRNLRWHPLIVAEETPPYASEVESIVIDSDHLVFVINDDLWYATDVHKLDDVWCAPLAKWFELKSDLAAWTDATWSKNSCVISAAEYASPQRSVEAFAVLGIAIVMAQNRSAAHSVYDTVRSLLADHDFPPSEEFPSLVDLDLCPLCKSPLFEHPAGLHELSRPQTFQNPWRKSKRSEGDLSSLQLFHVEPLIEQEVKHTPRLVRYGHRWCNIAMADNSLDRTVDFMEAVARAHNRM